MLQIGAVLQGRYRIEEQIGQGGMGAVFLARQIRLADRPVALKELLLTSPDADERRRFVAQFEREARILSSLSHPGLVDVKDFFEEQGVLVLVMEYVEGQTLSDLIFTPASIDEVLLILGWAEQLLEVLDYLHHHDPPIVLRDLKPDNIMLEPSGKIRVIDFGIAREQRTDQTSTTTVSGAGSPGYASPEQYAGRADQRADIYSLGATLYAVLSAQIPPVSVTRMTDNVELTPLEHLNPNVCPELSACLAGLMAIRREDRPQTIEEVRRGLSAATRAQETFVQSLEPMTWNAEPLSRPSDKPLKAPPTSIMPATPVTAFVFGDEGTAPGLHLGSLAMDLRRPAPVEPPPAEPARSQRGPVLLGVVLVVAFVVGVAFWHKPHNAPGSAPSPSASPSPHHVRAPHR